MFLLRSAFWLTVAFLVIGPKDVDLGAAAGDLSARAVAASQHVIATTILDTECANLQCLGGRAIAAAAVTTAFPSIDTAMQDSSNRPVPVPRPRPDWMG